ncbi:molybdenum cofactor guanylyltransferase [Saccharopolyspora gregorii]|uniref:molybdenum cofactor guanylyltransferase n=1 Tax=Saccharopolyspora gregorii TaxID=33914 RepID=UPI0021AD14F4|nr:NTP transferase domain-containing protein [Saccharopolyspora gregorii]
MVDEFAAVVLAGGSSRRLGGVDKLALSTGGRTLLAHTALAVRDADPVVVVGPRRPVPVPVRWAREDPPGSGPLAGLHAGLEEVPFERGLVAVLAADHPGLSAGTVARLRAAAAESGAVLVDADGAVQWLLGVWPVDVLRAAMPEQVRDRPVRALFGALHPAHVPAVGAEAADVDTPQDLHRLG